MIAEVPTEWSAENPGCPTAFSTSASYAAGEVVSVSQTDYTAVYQCSQDEATALYCGQNGFEPGTGIAWEQAWSELGSCNVALAPISDVPEEWSSENPGCPAAFSSSASYAAGDVVSVSKTDYTAVYQCSQDEATALYCGQNGFEPGTGLAWERAWGELGSCAGTLSPTSSPSFDVIQDAGGCPSEFSSDEVYDEGDKVSTNGFVYECKEGAVATHCSQSGYEPGTGSAFMDAWTLMGFCEGTIAPTSSPSFVALSDMGGCPDAWEEKSLAGESYEGGDAVSSNGLVYVCKDEPSGNHCSQAGYEPGTNPATPDAWKDAWELLGYCEGTIGPTSSPSFEVLQDLGGCPDEWVEKTPGDEAYEEGDRASDGKLVYECRVWPLSDHCGQAGYEPGTEPGTWAAAWTTVGHCSGSIGPTASPSFDVIPSVGACPEEWVAKSATDVAAGDTYEEGDMVSVVVSTEPIRKVAYSCKTWPYSDHCKQYSPADSLGGELGWTLAGSCDGSGSPTASPSFNTLADTGTGCPPEYSSANSEYEAGDQVSLTISTSPDRKIVYQCREWPNDGYCGQAGFAPGSKYSNYGWETVGSCSGSMQPTASPLPYVGTCQYSKCVTTKTTEACTVGEDGCGDNGEKTVTTETCTDTDIEAYSSNLDYVTGDEVRIGDERFKCREWPNYLWCRMSAYQPMTEENGIWPQAWTANGSCPPATP